VAWFDGDGPQGSLGFFRRLSDAESTWTAPGDALTASGAPGRFCATRDADTAVTLCAHGLCAALGTVVRPTVHTRQLNGSFPATVRVPVAPSSQRVCIPLTLEAVAAGEAPIDASRSPGLRFAQVFSAPVPNPLHVDYDPATGLPTRDPQGNPCFEAVIGMTGIRIFYGSAQLELFTELQAN
jgi:hypothetical protein